MSRVSLFCFCLDFLFLLGLSVRWVVFCFCLELCPGLVFGGPGFRAPQVGAVAPPRSAPRRWCPRSGFLVERVLSPARAPLVVPRIPWCTRRPVSRPGFEDQALLLLFFSRHNFLYL